MKRFLFCLAILFGCFLPVVAQELSVFGASKLAPKTAWSATLQAKDARRGEATQIVITARVPKDWHIYSLTQKAGGPLPTTIKLTPNATLQSAGKATQPKPKVVRDEGFGMNVELLEGTVVFKLPVKIVAKAPANSVASIQVRSMMCNDKNCLPPTVTTLKVAVRPANGAARPERTQIASLGNKSENNQKGSDPNTRITMSATQNDVASQVRRAQSRGALPFMLFAFGAGIIALLTPCVFPMIPITVSIFARPQSDNSKRRDWLGPIVYCVGIIGTFTVLDLPFSPSQRQREWE